MSVLRDPRVTELAKLLINYSVSLRKGEKVLIEATGVLNEVIIALIQEATAVGGTPFISLKDDQIIRELNLYYGEDDIKLMTDLELYRLQRMDAFIGIRGFHNIYELSDVPAENLRSIRKHYFQPVHLVQRNENTRWVFLRWPTPGMAQRAEMSTVAFEALFFDACNVDYAKMEAAMDPLVRLMQRTDEVKIVGPGDTDLSFSIKGMPQCKFAGRHNVPDGELFTAPIRNSLNGRIRYNVPSVFYGTVFVNVCFEFRDGRVINVTCNHSEKMKEILDQDEGARYVGEFAFGFNPHITKPIKDILFDEKMAGSLHLAQGNAYRECDNGNISAIHWDLILDQTPDMGGGEVYFDNLLIRKDGLFVLEELAGLNPNYLI